MVLGGRMKKGRFEEDGMVLGRLREREKDLGRLGGLGGLRCTMRRIGQFWEAIGTVGLGCVRRTLGGQEARFRRTSEVRRTGGLRRTTTGR